MFKTLKYLIGQIKRNKKKSVKISYTASLLKGKNNISLKKFLEESKELFKASHYNNKKEIIHEAADLLYHFLELLEFKKISVNSVLRELEKSKKISGIKEKNNRKYNVR
jgi:phosphoribosyl-ATP pyrophosphohydrolase